MRSVLAVLAGIVVLTAASFAIEALANPLIMRAFPHTLQNEAALNQNVPVKLFTIAYSTLCVVAGGYAAATIARRFPVRHAVIMGVIQVALTLAAMLKFYGHAYLWVWIAGIALTVPAAAWGGAIRARQSAS
jgi:hypothetical protein